MCDGEKSAWFEELDWKEGDKIEVNVVCEGDAAHVTFRFKWFTEERTLLGVPPCGLRFGAGLMWKDDSVTMAVSTVDGGVRCLRRWPGSRRPSS